MTVTITGVQAHTARLLAMREKMRTNVTLALIDYGGKIQDIATASIKLHGIPSPNHIVSAPGQPPNADTHDLDRSIHTRFQGETADTAITGASDSESAFDTRVVVEVVAGGSTAPYAPGLEVGTARVAARPFMRPASQQASVAGKDGVRAAVVRTLQG